jgi:hypothetical protein
MPATPDPGFKSAIGFTPAERTAHQESAAMIADTAAKYLQAVWKEHVAFHKKHGFSKFYGDRSKSLDTPAKRIAALRQIGAPESLVDQLQPTSCVGLAMKALQAGLTESGNAPLKRIWEKILAYMKENDMYGTALHNALQKLDWKLYYWNPSPKDNKRWDEEDGTRASRGYHAWRYHTVMTKNAYHYNKVDDRELLVDFDTKVPARFKQFPFFIGIANTGYHVFPGFKGHVIEAHSTRPLASIDNLEDSPFNPLEKGGGPRWSASEKYRSGLIAVPPV